MGATRESLKQRWKAYNKAVSTQPKDLAFWQDVIESGHFRADEVGFLYESLNSHDKSRGVFYTPAELAKKLTDATLGKYLTGILQALQSNPKQALADQVLNLRILDPACGCGVFLLSAFDCLYDFYGKLPNSIRLPENIQAHIAERQLYGVDIDATAIAIARLLLAQHSGSETMPVYAGNALIDRAPETPDFCWQEAFGDRAWDFVLGNPPYISEVRGQKELFRQLQKNARLSVAYTAKMDLADWFVALSIQALKPQGTLGLVLPEYWTHRSAGVTMRTMLSEAGKVRELHTFDDAQFSRAQGHHSSLLIWQKTGQKTGASQKNKQAILWNGEPGLCWQRDKESPLLYGNQEEMAALEKMAAHAGRIPAGNIQQGIVIPQGTLNAGNHEKLSHTAQQRYPVGGGIFILSDTEIEKLQLNPEERKLLKPYFGPGDFSRAGFTQQHDWILYIGATEKSLLTTTPERYPHLRRHLDTFAGINTSSNAPYGLHRPRQAEWFDAGEKIFCLRQTEQPCFAVIQDTAYVGEGFCVIKPLSGWTCEQLAAVLNSDAAWFWFLKHKHKGRRLQVDKDVLCGFPLPETPVENLENPYALTASEVSILSAALKPL